jgi:DNA-binding GntR family transcriptional regulator
MDDYSPKYVQIYDKLRSDIILRNYLPGGFLPTEKQLMDMFEASRGTVRKALSHLQNDGFISVQQGSGSSVLNFSDSRDKFDPSRWHAVDVTMEFFRDASTINTTPIALDQVEAEKEVALALNMESGALVYRIQRIRMIEEAPYLYRIQYLRQDLMPCLEKHIPEIESSITFYEEIYDIHLTSSVEHISAKSADFLESRILGVELGTALLRTRRINICEKGPFEYAEFIANPAYQGYKINAKYG